MGFKRGDVCIFDKNNLLKLELYKPTIVRIVKRVGIRSYLCMNIDNEIPDIPNNYFKSLFMTYSKYLSEYPDFDKQIVLRSPSIPPISKKDLEILKYAINYLENKLEKEDIHALSSLYFKLKYYKFIRKEYYDDE